MRKILLRKGIHQLHSEMTIQINVLKKIKTAKEKYIHLPVENIAQIYHQIMGELDLGVIDLEEEVDIGQEAVVHGEKIFINY